jgi:hypothetical protein
MDSRLSYLYDVISQAINENSVSELNSVKPSYSMDEILQVSLLSYKEQDEKLLVIAMKKKRFMITTKLMKIFGDYLRTKVGIKFLGQCDPKYLLAIQELFSHEIPLPEVIDNIIQDLDYTWWLPLLAEIIKMSRKSISRQGKIVALEFIGASLIMFESGALPLTGLRCWEKAMTLRYSPADGELPIPKIPLRGLLGLSGEVFGSAIEVMSMEEIKEWEHHFMMLHVRFPTLPQTLQIQALLIQHRICSEENPRQTSPSCLYLKSLLTHGNRLFDSGRYDHAINTYLLVLEQITGFDPKMTHPRAIEDFNVTLGKLSSCFNTLLREPLTSPKREKLSPANIVMAIKFCTTIAKFFPKPKKNYSISWNHSSFVGHIYDFLIILVDVSPQMNSQDKKQLEEHISSYINSNEKTSPLFCTLQFGLISSTLKASICSFDSVLTQMPPICMEKRHFTYWPQNGIGTIRKTNCTCKYFKPW